MAGSLAGWPEPHHNSARRRKRPAPPERRSHLARNREGRTYGRVLGRGRARRKPPSNRRRWTRILHGRPEAYRKVPRGGRQFQLRRHERAILGNLASRNEEMSGERIQLITDALVESVIEQARRSPRQRMNYNFHASHDENPHRFLNVFLEGSYAQPHRHLKNPKAESFIVLRGHMAAFIFDESGNVTSGHILGPGIFSGAVPAHIQSQVPLLGIDLAPGVWHTVAALTPVAVCYEV